MNLPRDLLGLGAAIGLGLPKTAAATSYGFTESNGQIGFHNAAGLHTLGIPDPSIAISTLYPDMSVELSVTMQPKR